MTDPRALAIEQRRAALQARYSDAQAAAVARHEARFDAAWAPRIAASETRRRGAEIDPEHPPRRTRRTLTGTPCRGRRFVDGGELWCSECGWRVELIVVREDGI